MSRPAGMDPWLRLLHAEVCWTLERVGVPHVVLKGASVADWLYAPEERRFGDVDVLVPADRLAAALTALAARDLHHELAGAAVGEAAVHSVTLRRRTPAGGLYEVDVHTAFPGLEVADAYAALAEHVTTMPVAHRSVPVLAEPARLVLLVLHAGRNGVAAAQSVQDLRRALARIDEPAWRVAGELVRGWGATGLFAAALRMLPEGAALADRLALPTRASAAWRLRTMSAPGPAHRLNQLLEAPWPQRLRLLAREALPTAPFMRYAWPLARRGRLGLTAAYVQRWCGLGVRLPRMWRLVRAVRRDASSRG